MRFLKVKNLIFETFLFEFSENSEKFENFDLFEYSENSEKSDLFEYSENSTSSENSDWLLTVAAASFQNIQNIQNILTQKLSEN